jgi:hypothetical protein
METLSQYTPIGTVTFTQEDIDKLQEIAISGRLSGSQEERKKFILELLDEIRENRIHQVA